MKLIFNLVILCYCWSNLISLVYSENIAEAIKNRPNLSKFSQWLKDDLVITVFLEQRVATVFAPTNDAVNKYLEELNKRGIQRQDERIVSLHVVGLEVQRDLFPLSVSSRLQEAPPLYLGVKTVQTGLDYHRENPIKEYFVNNALILEKEEFVSKSGGRQILYIIDQVIDLWVSTTPLPPLALDLIQNNNIYDSIQDHFDQFSQRIQSTRQENLFSRPGNHTFFIPRNPLSGRFDEYVVKGHVISNNVLFLRVIGSDIYHSAAYDNSVNVDLSLRNRTIKFGQVEPTYYIQSNTLKSDQQHSKGVVMSRIVHANIPVRNGVVHIIEKPLMIIDLTVYDFLAAEKDKLSIFKELLDTDSSIRNEFNIAQTDKTVLAPVDSAFVNLLESPVRKEEERQKVLERLTKDHGKLRDLLLLHLIHQSYSSDDARTKPQVVSADGKRNLYFRLGGDEKKPKFTVEGGAVNATVIQADIATTNGMIHVIDRVLGMPFQNLFDKLKTDPELTFTYKLGEQGQRWNEQLTYEDRRYTYFVPSDKAWQEFKINNPSEYKQLDEGLYPGITRRILDRHLCVKRQISSSELENSVYTINGEFKVERNYGQVNIEWQGKKATIIRPDIQAINGVIHVIDNVLIFKRDFDITNSSSRLTALNIITMLIIVLITKLYY